MKIIKPAPYYDPEQVSSSHLNADLYRAITDDGYTLELYVPTPSRGVSKELRSAYKKKKYEEQMDGRLIIHRFSMIPEGTNPIQRAIKYIASNFVQYRRCGKLKDVDLIFSASTPPTQGVLCGKLKKKLSKKYGRPVPFLYELQDLFPDSLVNADLAGKKSLFYRIGLKIEAYTYKSADKIITISDDFKNILLKKGVPEEKIVVIPNWVNADEVYPVPREENDLFDTYDLDRGRFYVCYSGNLGASQNLELLLLVAEKMKTELPDVTIVLVGEGVAKAELEEKIRAGGITNIVVLPFQDYSEIAKVFSLGDVGLIISKPGVGISSVPSKTWSIMAAQRPILASFDAESDLFRIIEKTGTGIAVPAGACDELVEAIRTLKDDPQLRADMGKRGRTYLVEELDKDKCVGGYLDTIRSLVQQ